MGKILIIKDSDFSEVAVGKVTPISTTPPDIFIFGYQVTITHDDAQQIYYTIDGSLPTTNSEIYTTPFTVLYGTTVKAIGVVNGVQTPVGTNKADGISLDPDTFEHGAARVRQLNIAQRTGVNFNNASPIFELPSDVKKLNIIGAGSTTAGENTAFAVCVFVGDINEPSKLYSKTTYAKCKTLSIQNNLTIDLQTFDGTCDTTTGVMNLGYSQSGVGTKTEIHTHFAIQLASQTFDGTWSDLTTTNVPFNLGDVRIGFIRE